MNSISDELLSDVHPPTADNEIRCVRRVSAETQLSASEGKVADIGGINILKRGETAAPIHVKRLTLLIRGVGDSRITEVRETVERYRR